MRLVANDLVVMDDLHLLADVVLHACHHYPRDGLLKIPFTVLTRYAHEQKKKLVFSADGHVASPLSEWCQYVEIGEFEPVDYSHLCATFLGEGATRLDFRKIHRFASSLSGHDLRAACLWFRGRNDLDTEKFIDYLRRVSG